MTAIDRIKQLVDAGHLHPHIQQTYPLSEIATAISTSMGGQVIGKLAISVVGSEPESEDWNRTSSSKDSMLPISSGNVPLSAVTDRSNGPPN